MQEPASPWWAQPDAQVRIATIANEGTTCPICSAVDETGQLELRFPMKPGPLLGMVLACGHAVDAAEWDLAVTGDMEGFWSSPANAGEYPVMIVDRQSGNVDLIGLRVADTEM